MARLATAEEILQEVMGSAAEHGIQVGGAALLGAAMSAAVANPMALVLASVAKALAKSLFEHTSALDKKLDQVISEPFSTATKTLDEVLSIKVASSSEEDERQRRLTAASDDLRKAYTYATKLQPDRCLLIRMYQALVDSQRKGGGPFASLYLHELRGAAEAMRRDASALQDKVRWLREPVTEAEIRRARGDNFVTTHSVQKINFSQADFLEESAIRPLDKKATCLESYCEFVDSLITNQLQILESSPGAS